MNQRPSRQNTELEGGRRADYVTTSGRVYGFAIKENVLINLYIGYQVNHDFIKRSEQEDIDLADWVCKTMNLSADKTSPDHKN